MPPSLKCLGSFWRMVQPGSFRCADRGCPLSSHWSSSDCGCVHQTDPEDRSGLPRTSDRDPRRLKSLPPSFSVRVGFPTFPSNSGWLDSCHPSDSPSMFGPGCPGPSILDGSNVRMTAIGSSRPYLPVSRVFWTWKPQGDVRHPGVSTSDPGAGFPVLGQGKHLIGWLAFGASHLFPRFDP